MGCFVSLEQLPKGQSWNVLRFWRFFDRLYSILSVSIGLWVTQAGRCVSDVPCHAECFDFLPIWDRCRLWFHQGWDAMQICLSSWMTSLWSVCCGVSLLLGNCCSNQREPCRSCYQKQTDLRPLCTRVSSGHHAAPMFILVGSFRIYNRSLVLYPCSYIQQVFGVCTHAWPIDAFLGSPLTSIYAHVGAMYVL